MKFYWILGMIFCTSLAASSPVPPINTARLLLTKLRGGDYAHAGDNEAVDRVVQRVLELAPQVKAGPCLDVGSGFGGTANDMVQKGFHSVWGIDLDGAAIQYAKERYPTVQFIHADAQALPKLFHPDYFSFIYLFNVIYAIPDKRFLLSKLSSVAKPGAILAIFDYTIEDKTFDLKDLAGKPMYPLVFRHLEEDLKASGWEILDVEDLSESYHTWYHQLLDKLSEERLMLLKEFSEQDLDRVRETFTKINSWLKSSSLGGAVIYCRKSF